MTRRPTRRELERDAEDLNESMGDDSPTPVFVGDETDPDPDTTVAVLDPDGGFENMPLRDARDRYGKLAFHDYVADFTDTSS